MQRGLFSPSANTQVTMRFKIKPSLLARRKKIIEEGVDAAARWPKDVRDEYLSRSMKELTDESITPEITDQFRWDMRKAKKALVLMGKPSKVGV